LLASQAVEYSDACDGAFLNAEDFFLLIFQKLAAGLGVDFSLSST